MKNFRASVEVVTPLIVLALMIGLLIANKKFIERTNQTLVDLKHKVDSTITANKKQDSLFYSQPFIITDDSMRIDYTPPKKPVKHPRKHKDDGFTLGPGESMVLSFDMSGLDSIFKAHGYKWDSVRHMYIEPVILDSL